MTDSQLRFATHLAVEVVTAVLTYRRVGAICHDNTLSCATGPGACSHHGGVRTWLLAMK